MRRERESERASERERERERDRGERKVKEKRERKRCFRPPFFEINIKQCFSPLTKAMFFPTLPSVFAEKTTNHYSLFSKEQ